MRNRRFAQISTSDEEDETIRPSLSSNQREENNLNSKRIEAEEYEQEVNGSLQDEPMSEDAKPFGDVIKVSGKGRGRRSHFQGFEFDGNIYEIEDPVLLVPEDTVQKPYVAIIKDISQIKAGNVLVTGQWFYRSEEAEKRGGGSWRSSDTRELFYSFHRDEVPAESVMHKCFVHFIPLHKQLPNRKQHPGFIVRKVYDTVERKLWKLTDKDYEDIKQHEIELLVQKTLLRLGDDLLDIESEDNYVGFEDSIRNAKQLKRKNLSPIDVSRSNETTTRCEHLKGETPRSCASTISEYHVILEKFNALTGDTHRDKCLERLLEDIQFVCDSIDSAQTNGEEKSRFNGVEYATNGMKSANESHGTNLKGGGFFRWSDEAVSAVTALEKAAHNTFFSDYQKYNQKMRSLRFNLKKNGLLAHRLLNGELEPSKILSMSPNELKDGMTEKETGKKEPKESEHMQMTDARCRRCTEKQVGLTKIIQAGSHARYQLECIACGNTWYASSDEVSSLTINDLQKKTEKLEGMQKKTEKLEGMQKKTEKLEGMQKKTEKSEDV